MKKAINIFYCLLAIFVLCSAVFQCVWMPDTTSADPGDTQRAVLPSALQSISGEAFSGTVFRTVYLHDQVVYIGSEAFANSKNLKDVFIPDSVTYIGANAFSLRVRIHGGENSFAQTWARENGYVFVTEDRLSVQTMPQGIRLTLMLAVLILAMTADAPKLSGIRRRLWASLRSMRPQDRPELYPINYRFP